ncbi:hypothetical protein E3P86_00233 [Wallemia ichthyophaga]|uniref:Coiled-coil domain-containing protein 12 n=1 Tax=Wallemia ichthyophaga TaxID=245174 RepID=A0A4T0JJG1_WALIC|nr:hypothetical protein E3P86_00233 [Wallemia ichthyophaga]
MEAASHTRKQRLEALNNRTHGTGEHIVKFRNYDPTSREVKKGDNSQTSVDTVESAVTGLVDSILDKDEELRNEDLDIFNIAPKRPNWDMRRQLTNKMSLLNKADQLAINTLLRNRLSNPNNNNVNNGAALSSASNKLIHYSDQDD